MEDYQDPYKLAKARWRGGKKHTYAEMADELDCSEGAISVWMSKKRQEVEQWGPSDFEDLPYDYTREHFDKPEIPLDLDLPAGLPTHLEDGTSMDIIIKEAKHNNWFEKKILDEYLREHHDVTLQDITEQELQKCPQCENFTIIYFIDGKTKCGNCGA